MGTQLAGAIGQRRPVEEVRKPLFASALVMEQEGRKFCILVLDLTLATKAWVQRIRQGAVERFGFDHDAVMVCTTQTHSAPYLGHAFEYKCEYIPANLRWLMGGDDAFNELAVEYALSAIGQATTKLEPVTVAAASGIEGRVAHNRRFVMRDGTTTTHPRAADPQIRHAEGPIDPEVGVVGFRNNAGETVAALLHFTCHPNHGYPHLYASADWPGVWASGVRALCGEQCIPLVFNGCCGNIHHYNHLDPHHKEDLQRVGKLLIETTATILPRLEYKEIDAFKWKTLNLPLPWREVEPRVFQEARDLLDAFPEPIWFQGKDKKVPLLGRDLSQGLPVPLDEKRTQVAWDWMYAASLLDVEKQMQASPTFDYEIQALRIGDIALAAFPGEPFVEAQLEIKLKSPTYPTYLAHMSNQLAGYIPTAEALARGGFETRLANWSKLAPEALGMIVEATGEMFCQLFKAPSKKYFAGVWSEAHPE